MSRFVRAHKLKLEFNCGICKQFLRGFCNRFLALLFGTSAVMRVFSNFFMGQGWSKLQNKAGDFTYGSRVFHNGARSFCNGYRIFCIGLRSSCNGLRSFCNATRIFYIASRSFYNGRRNFCNASRNFNIGLRKFHTALRILFCTFFILGRSGSLFRKEVVH